jgi:hypothetical protein
MDGGTVAGWPATAAAKRRSTDVETRGNRSLDRTLIVNLDTDGMASFSFHTSETRRAVATLSSYTGVPKKRWVSQNFENVPLLRRGSAPPTATTFARSNH